MSQFKVCAAVVDDVPDLVRLHEASWREVFSPTIEYPINDARQKWSDALSTYSLQAFVASQDGSLVAFSAMSITTRIAEITDLYVLPFYRRHGIARSLLTSTLQAVAPNLPVVLWIAKRNLSAIKLYESMQFAPSGREKREPRRTDDAELIEMKRNDRGA